MNGCNFFLFRRESPWKVDGDSTGVSSKLKTLEQELLTLERVCKADLSKVPSQMRKQAKRYQALAGKIDDLCGRMVIVTIYVQKSCDGTTSIYTNLAFSFSLSFEFIYYSLVVQLIMLP